MSIGGRYEFVPTVVKSGHRASCESQFEFDFNHSQSLGARRLRAVTRYHTRQAQVPLCRSCRKEPGVLLLMRERLLHSPSVYHMNRPTPSRGLYKNTTTVTPLIAAYHRPSTASPHNGTSFTCALSRMYGIKK